MRRLVSLPGHGVDARRDNRRLGLSHQSFTVNHTKHDLRIWMRHFFEAQRCSLDSAQRQLRPGSDVQQDSPGARNRIIVQERARDGALDGREGAAFLRRGSATPHHSPATILKNAANMREVQVYNALVSDQVADTRHRIAEHLVREPHGFGDGQITTVQETVVLDHQKRIDLLFQESQPFIRGSTTLEPFEHEGLRHNAHDERAARSSRMGHDWGRPSPCSAAHTDGHKDHVCIRELSGDGPARLERRRTADFASTARPKSARRAFAENHGANAMKSRKSLCVRVKHE
ncbi:MAG: hypothetical protein ACI9KE_003896 [Polyangiales bacterium]